MNLTDKEKRMLNGSEGILKQKAMENVVKYAHVLGAEKLCVVTKAHLFCGSHSYMRAVNSDDIDEVISEMHFCSSKKVLLDRVECYAQADVGPMCPYNWKKMGVSDEEHEKNMKYLKRYLDAGVQLVGSCVPYMLGFIPLMGEHYVTSESHAVLMMNSLWGACGQADGLEAGFWSAVCGRTPLWGLHIMENRKGTLVFDIECATETVYDWDILGYTIGRKTPTHSIPVLRKGFQRPDMTKLKSSFASMATTGGPEMCHIVGVTPEARSVGDALGGNTPLDIITITERDIEESLSMLCETGRAKLDYISLGCPHYTIEQMMIAANFLKGKKVHSNTVLHIWTAAPIKETADRCGYTEIIERAGGIVLTSSCPLTSEKKPDGAVTMAFDSGKQAHYIKPGSGAKVYFGSMEDCLKSAISGYWEGR
ncbi:MULTISPECIES: aconitase X catalytic domain-containing protein [Aminobacterium]|uniref:aconitase X catalytic domain-containing protein n=1 Tax=Aminobacterium TaxID=81466 RepID=UPI00257C4169|nr:aconitase X catalytic domain-containing protein [Aminobacterium sp. UBA4987]